MTFDEAEKTHIVLLHETWRESLARDLGTAATFLFLWSIGHYAGSDALEWVGIAIGFIVLSVRAMRRMSEITPLTPDQTREWLNAKFPKEVGK